MKVAALIAGMALFASAAEAGTAGRYRPADPGLVVLEVPARAASDPIAVLEQRHAREPGNEFVAAELAQRYVERARETREQRYFSRAEALLQSWVKRADAQAVTLRVQADILQNRHEFSAATRLLDRAIARDPRDAGSHLMRASVKIVQGLASDARSDCVAVLAAGESALGTVCLAQVLGATGDLARAEALMHTVLTRAATEPRPSVRAWALGLLADFADRAGNTRASEEYLRSALGAVPGNEGVRVALADLLMARGAHREALTLVDLPAPSMGLLVRRARAQLLLNDPRLTETRSDIESLRDLLRRRGDEPHLREEALFALHVEHDAAHALELAKANFQTQRETLDVRLLARAAQAAGDLNSQRELANWLRETRYEDHAIRSLLTSKGSLTSDGPTVSEKRS
jgi:tetratricopeptide (TPR) repeat protein